MVARLRILAKSATVGGIATGVDLVALFLLVSALGVDARIANVPALALGIATQFIGNKFFAFEDRSRAWARQGALFLGVESLALGANAVAFHGLISATPVPYLLARLMTTALVYFAISLPLWSLIFQPRRETA